MFSFLNKTQRKKTRTDDKTFQVKEVNCSSFLLIRLSQQITQSVSIPVIGDGGNGYGNAMNVKRTVKGYIKAGFAGIIINDQVCCEDTKSEIRVASREELVMHIKAAVDARRECGSDIFIVDQTDSREAISLEESLIRARAFTDAGANMLESGGKVPILNPLELEEIAYKLVAYPISLIGVSIQAMQDALLAIKGGRIPSPGSMASFEEIEEILGFETYLEEEKCSSVCGNQRVAQDDPEQREDPIVEVITPEVYDEPRNPFSRIWSRSLRIKIMGLRNLMSEFRPDSWKVSPTIQHCSRYSKTQVFNICFSFLRHSYGQTLKICSFRRREFEAIDG
ncbi:hypothetical protein ARALYDRAFT_913232 [Arabidopsis lyrata subsp. lyrata]|uniref:Uncharacterized protein n=1 Tax=Arabidopsis lyrata subsp. lyrata TaxID=81972 RepID=D7MAQ8_ARALL|nr:hypothetical protein ARALYDRAFT_913232 [Arabidopsis lyrata subsp. lyrata]